MRVTKKDGKFVVDDKPMRLEGDAAKRFLAAMRTRDAAARSPEQDQFLKDCDRAYSRAKRQD